MFQPLRLLFLAYALVEVSFAVHIKGSFDPDDFFKFIVKFGFQKTDIHAKMETYGYIFGNITSNFDYKNRITFAVLDRPHFIDYYSNRELKNKDEACAMMFQYLSSAAYHRTCNPKGQDMFRKVPCPRNKLCFDEDTPLDVIKGNQFTYVVHSPQPRFWYVSIVACYLDEETCEWRHYQKEKQSREALPQLPNSEIKYDFWMVNGNPNLSMSNTFLHQFSFDRQNTLELYLLFWLCYILLVPLQLYAVRIQKHPVTRLFTGSLMMEFAGLCFIVLHNVTFALNGVGFPRLAVAGDILDIMSRTIFMLLLLLLAKGWAVTRLELTWKPVVFGVWLCYGIVHILLYIWNWTEVDIIEEIDEYQTWPGWLILSLRVAIMAWFVLELRNTMLYEHNLAKLNFLLHFGASSLVWFVYLPVIALVALQISPLWRYKFLLGITYSADCMAFFVMAHLLWPTRSEQYLLLAPSNYAGLEELDEFNESPHLVHSDSMALTSSVSHDADDEDEVLFTAHATRPNGHYSAGHDPNLHAFS